jgi:ketosteroid isomerase-like protein
MGRIGTTVLSLAFHREREMEMSQTNVAVAQIAYAAYARGDIPAVLEVLTPDVEWHSTGRPEDFPALGPRKGLAAVQDFFNTVGQHIQFSEFSPQEFYADRDKVFVLGHYTVMVKNTGRKFTSDWIHIFSFRGGRVAQFREFLDTAKLASAFRE